MLLQRKRESHTGSVAVPGLQAPDAWLHSPFDAVGSSHHPFVVNEGPSTHVFIFHTEAHLPGPVAAHVIVLRPPGLATNFRNKMPRRCSDHPEEDRKDRDQDAPGHVHQAANPGLVPISETGEKGSGRSQR